MEERTLHSKHLFSNQLKPENFTPPIIVGWDIKTPENIGNIIRLADNIGCNQVLFVTENENLRSSKIKKTASSSFTKVDWSFCKETDLNNNIPENYKWIAIETTSDSQNIYKTKLPQKAAFIVGNEIKGTSSEILNKCDKIVHIPMFGKNTSMNVSHALAVALYEWQRQITEE